MPYKEPRRRTVGQLNARRKGESNRSSLPTKMPSMRGLTKAQRRMPMLLSGKMLTDLQIKALREKAAKESLVRMQQLVASAEAA